ncbi:MAG TPA: hypothetical protein VMR75_00080 [Candidatus Saccharimonadales bacterium]|nr:hypothetical protein [Candidatus Saccharimonadales bacterium]
MAETPSPPPENGPPPSKDLSDGLLDSGFDTRHKTWTHQDRPDLIFRDASVLPAGSEKSRERHNRYEIFTKALFALESYGINIPGIGNARQLDNGPRHDIDNFQWETLYTVTRRVEGKNLHENMTEIPAPVVLQTIEGMLRYYEDRLEDTSEDPYITDLGLGQMLYGKAPGDTQNSVYFIDLELDQLDRRKDILNFDNAIDKIERDIAKAEQIYHQDLDGYRQRLEQIEKEVRSRGH